MSIYKVVKTSVVYVVTDNEESAKHVANDLIATGMISEQTNCSNIIKFVYDEYGKQYLLEHQDGPCFNSLTQEVELKDAVEEAVKELSESIKSKVQAICTKEDVAQWWMKEYLPNETHYFEYSAMVGKIGSLFNSLKVSGYNPDTNQAIVELVFCRSADTPSSLMEELSYFLPYITPFNNIKMLAIFENSLSEHGSYSLHIFDDNNAKIVKSFHRTELDVYSGSLFDCITYIGQNLYYE